MNHRFVYLDWLKVIAVLLLVPAHAARIYDYLPFYVKQEPQLLAELFIRFLDVWFMPLFFVIGGVAAFYSIEKRGAQRFRRERFQRVLLPLLLAIITHLPLLGYIACSFHHPERDLSFWQYLPVFLSLDARQLEGYTGTFSTAHLWYLLYLYIYCVFGAPLLSYLRKGKLPQWMRRAPLAAALLFVRLGKFTLLPYPNPLYFFAFFMIGYTMCVPEANFDVRGAVRKYPARTILVAMAGMITLLVARILYLPDYGPFALYLVMQPVYCITAVLWVAFILVAAERFLQSSHPVLQYLSEAALFIYIAHMLILVFLAAQIFEHRPDWPAPVAFIAMLLGTLLLLNLVYEFFVRRFRIVRYLFGLGALPK